MNWLNWLHFVVLMKGLLVTAVDLHYLSFSISWRYEYDFANSIFSCTARYFSWKDFSVLFEVDCSNFGVNWHESCQHINHISYDKSNETNYSDNNNIDNNSSNNNNNNNNNNNDNNNNNINNNNGRWRYWSLMSLSPWNKARAKNCNPGQSNWNKIEKSSKTG